MCGGGGEGSGGGSPLYNLHRNGSFVVAWLSVR